MARNKFGKWEYTDEEIRVQTDEATARARRAILEEPHAKAAYYDKRQHKITVELSNGNAVTLDLAHLPELAKAPRKDRRPSSSGAGVHSPQATGVTARGSHRKVPFGQGTKGPAQT